MRQTDEDVSVNQDYAVAWWALGMGPTLSGDFDLDGDVDGQDFLVWQRGNSPDPLSAGDLADWQSGYGNPPSAATEVPESGSAVLLVLAMTCAGGFKGRWYGERSACAS